MLEKRKDGNDARSVGAAKGLYRSKGFPKTHGLRQLRAKSSQTKFQERGGGRYWPSPAVVYGIAIDHRDRETGSNKGKKGGEQNVHPSPAVPAS